MGAEEFSVRAKGKDAKTAFWDVVERAIAENGNSGYTGTIAEKHEFTMIPLPIGAEPRVHARALLEANDPRISDKWGPAGCIELGDGDYLFFGLASS